ncbi:hypothetical protein C8J57DRAFT_1565429 [Mycena rebaudengoi]|nr:hypothetical protein C8J57DRAFT_1565429 [Mycena rebaudengoi]
MSGPSHILSSEMESSPDSSCPRFSDGSENCEPAIDLSTYELSEGEVATANGMRMDEIRYSLAGGQCLFRNHTLPAGFWVYTRTKIFHLERVTGLPSQFPITVEPTGFLINLTGIPNLGNETVDAILKDEVCLSLKDMQGSRSVVDAQVSAILFGCNKPKSIDCRRSRPKCRGCYACESLAPEFLNIQRRGLDPHSRESLVQAQLRTREREDNTRVGQVLAYALSFVPIVILMISPDF